MGVLYKKKPHRQDTFERRRAERGLCREGYGLLGANTCLRKTKRDRQKKKVCVRQDRDRTRQPIGQEKERGRTLMYLCGSKGENQAAWYTHSFQCISFFSPSNPQVDHHRQILSPTSMT